MFNFSFYHEFDYSFNIFVLIHVSVDLSENLPKPGKFIFTENTISDSYFRFCTYNIGKKWECAK